MRKSSSEFDPNLKFKLNVKEQYRIYTHIETVETNSISAAPRRAEVTIYE